MTACVLCPYGKASMTFPMAIPADAALAVLSLINNQSIATAGCVEGHTTEKTRAAGAQTVRFGLSGCVVDNLPEQGAHLVAVRAAGRDGWLPGVAGTRYRECDSSLGIETVIFARPDAKFMSVMFLPEHILRELFPTGTGAEIVFLRRLLPVQHDCPEQWLRDRLLRLANMVEESYANPKLAFAPLDRIRDALQRAGLRFDANFVGPTACVLPADAGDRISDAELGYWKEEAEFNTRCGSMEAGDQRLDMYMACMPG
eukprot:TRINITY_DN48428_c0_g1_i1.p1 TRINITY_DN48428_c0_g1~~TRINITY_DN48428_c0_g1_i1.p1  ORF type:complete len:257 (+),score=43.07 TRINITY_DN48428_c0_g1_i1:89-859(+)